MQSFSNNNFVKRWGCGRSKKEAYISYPAQNTSKNEKRFSCMKTAVTSCLQWQPALSLVSSHTDRLGPINCTGHSFSVIFHQTSLNCWNNLTETREMFSAAVIIVTGSSLLQIWKLATLGKTLLFILMVIQAFTDIYRGVRACHKGYRGGDQVLFLWGKVLRANRILVRLKSRLRLQNKPQSSPLHHRAWRLLRGVCVDISTLVLTLFLNSWGLFSSNLSNLSCIFRGMQMLPNKPHFKC